MIGFFAYKLTISFFVAFYSGLPGFWIALRMKKNRASVFFAVKKFCLTTNARIYKFLKIDFFVYCIKNTFFKQFNKKIAISKRLKNNEIDELLNEITISEICHLIGFTVVVIFQIIILILTNWYDIHFYLSFFNVIFNVYPVLLMERNKLRLKKLAIRLKN